MSSATPMAQQYLERKREYPDCMLLFQVGDFYEFFGDDARRASHVRALDVSGVPFVCSSFAVQLLNLALTRRGKAPSASGLDDMCGFPIASLDSYVEKLVMHHGLKVAICNQVESASSAKQRGGYKALVDRQVVRIVTPGSLVEDAMLRPDENNYLAALYPSGGDVWGLAWADLSTGEFVSTTATTERLGAALLRCSPREILLPESLREGDDELLARVIPSSCLRTFRATSSFSTSPQRPELEAAASPDQEALPAEVERAAAAAILDYAAFTQPTSSSPEDAPALRMRAPLHLESSDHMLIDASAWKALELTRSVTHGTKHHSLLHCIDSTVTPAGSRLLAAHLAAPLMHVERLERRLDAVAFLHERELLLRRLRRQLAKVFDVERSLQRLATSVGTPKDLKNIALTIHEAHAAAALLSDGANAKATMPSLLAECCEILVDDEADQCTTEDSESLAALAEAVLAALAEDVTALNSRTGFVRPGYHPELDALRRLATLDAEQTTAQRDALQQKYRARLGSTRLRVGYQQEKGYFIDIPHDEHNRLQRRATEQALDSAEEGVGPQAVSPWDELTMVQSLKNVVRYRTPELRDLNRDILEATLEVARLENEIFATLQRRVLARRDTLTRLAAAIARLDVAASHAQTALDRHLTRPVLDLSRELHIREGRHLVVERAHLQGKNSTTRRAFVPNSLHLVPSDGETTDAERSGSICLLTGPNMGGKSTYLRQNAHLVVLAQLGSFVPAAFARVGLVDKLFCRVGSADDLASDKSTFMVEMQDTATILTQATPRSLVVMDEVGRGTAVHDGVAIAGAVLEALAERSVRTLFATHFTALSTLLAPRYQDNVQLHRMEVLTRRRQPSGVAREDEGAVAQDVSQLVFSHRVVPGLATQSYGVYTAALAGCPAPVVSRAAELLAQLQTADNAGNNETDNDDAEQRLRRISAVVESKNSAKEIVRRVQELLAH
ncbi:hypothetical protein P43SY_002186 [Pythium insidiosum]|uniref:DNA mismatch repair proteins mutS family domain-containing protein n=1 Tax=Pythium insidiosum TaxID=114742 RepID=A0AAD5LFW2_PYTIN|nr:hypothetical protein P43SY_002186 [Pythium insidiosum]